MVGTLTTTLPPFPPSLTHTHTTPPSPLFRARACVCLCVMLLLLLWKGPLWSASSFFPCSLFPPFPPLLSDERVDPPFDTTLDLPPLCPMHAPCHTACISLHSDGGLCCVTSPFPSCNGVTLTPVPKFPLLFGFSSPPTVEHSPFAHTDRHTHISCSLFARIFCQPCPLSDTAEPTHMIMPLLFFCPSCSPPPSRQFSALLYFLWDVEFPHSPVCGVLAFVWLF